MAGKLKKLLASLMFISPAPLSQAAPHQTQAASPETAKTSQPHVKFDKYAKYRNAEQEILAQLVFYEGCARKAYTDIVGIWTVGIGNTVRPDGKKVTKNDYLSSNEQIYKYVVSHLEKEVYPALDKYITRKLSPNEMAAVVSLCYNCGTKVLGTNGQKTAFASALNTNNKKAIIQGFMKKVSTKKHSFVEALAVRRSLELHAYFNNIKLDDFQSFYVGGQRGLKVSDILSKDKNGKFSILKTDANTLSLIKKNCTTAPNSEQAKKFAWFGGNKKVAEFANLNGNNTYLAQIQDFQKTTVQPPLQKNILEKNKNFYEKG